MSEFYFGGIEKASTASVLVQERAAGMMSRLEYSPRLLEACGDIKLFFDCGSFTKPLSRQDIEAYARLIIHLAQRGELFAAPDAIGDQRKSQENYDFLLSLLPVELHNKVLWIYQYGSPLASLYSACEQYKRIGIGGLVPLLANVERATHQIARLASVVSSYPHVSPHYFGVTTCSIVRMLAAYHHDFSVDSATWLVGARFNRLITAHGQQINAGHTPRHETLARNVRTMREWIHRPALYAAAHRQLSFDELPA